MKIKNSSIMRASASEPLLAGSNAGEFLGTNKIRTFSDASTCSTVSEKTLETCALQTTSVAPVKAFMRCRHYSGFRLSTKHCFLALLCQFSIVAGLAGFLALLVSIFAKPVMQNIVASTSVELLNVTIRETRETSFYMEASFAVQKPWYAGAISCALSSIDDVKVNWVQNNFQRYLGRISMQSQELSGWRTIIHLQERFAIDDVDAFADFSLSLLREKRMLTWELHGTLPWIHVKLLGKYDSIDFRKEVQLKGFDELGIVMVNDLDLPGDDPQGRGILAEVDVTVRNPSTLQIHLGAVNVGLSYKDKHLGEFHTDSFFLGLGDTRLRLMGTLQPEDKPSAQEFFSSYIGGEMQGAIARPASCASEDCPSWLRTVLGSLKSKVLVPGFAGPPLVQRMSMPDLSMFFQSDTDVFMNATLAVRIAVPFGFAFAVDSLSANANLSIGGQVALNLNVPLSAAKWDPDPVAGEGWVFVQARGIKVTVLSRAALAHGVDQLVNGPSARWGAFGVGGVTIRHSLLGNLLISRIPISGLPIDMNPGLNSIQGAVVESFDILGGDVHGLHVSLQTMVPNPMVVHFQTPLFPFKLLLNEDSGHVGDVSLWNMNLMRGNTTLPAALTLESNKVSQGRVSTLIETYLNGRDQNLGLLGDPERADLCVTTLKPALSALHSSVLVPGFAHRLMTYAKIDFQLHSLMAGHLPVRILVKNPWTASFTIESIEADIFIFDGHGYDIKLGHLLYREPVHVGGGGRSSYTPDLAVNLEEESCAARNFDVCLASLKALFGEILIRVDANVSLSIGDGFAVLLAYTEVNLPASFLPDVNGTGQHFPLGKMPSTKADAPSQKEWHEGMSRLGLTRPDANATRHRNIIASKHFPFGKTLNISRTHAGAPNAILDLSSMRGWSPSAHHKVA